MNHFLKTSSSLPGHLTVNIWIQHCFPLLFESDNSSIKGHGGDFKLDSNRREPYISSGYTLIILMSFLQIVKKRAGSRPVERDFLKQQESWLLSLKRYLQRSVLWLLPCQELSVFGFSLLWVPFFCWYPPPRPLMRNRFPPKSGISQPTG